jgi:DNA-binding beta-propeller fold protein YncE
VVRRISLKGCDGPTGLALDARTKMLVSACGNGVALAVSAVDGAILATLPIGKGPDAVMFDENNRRFLVPCGRDGVLTVIGAQTDGSLKVVETVPTAKGARTGAIDQKTGKVYLPTADFGPGKTGERPVARPGSFRLLVLDRT